MFGYISVNKPELKIKDYDQYRAYYCGLCQTLKKEHGRFGQIALNYDMLFIVLLLSGLYEPSNIEENHRCVMHPLTKHRMIENQFSGYASDMTIVLAYYKSEDDWKDERKYSKLMYKSLLKSKMKRLEEKYPLKTKNIKQYLVEMAKCEQEKSMNIDYLSSLFGKVMQEIVVYKDDSWQEELRQVGDYLGRFVYLLDAYEDIEQDIKKKQFNPLINRYQEDGFDEWMQEILEMMMAKCSEAYEVLPIIEHSRILYNILYVGVWNKYILVRQRRLERDGSI